MPELIVMVDEFIESQRDTFTTKWEEFEEHFIEDMHINTKREKGIKFMDFESDNSLWGKTEK